MERADVELLQTLLAQGIVPVVPPLGFDGDGKTYRVNSDSVAVAAAEAFKAIKLIFITTQDGLFRQRLAGDLEAVLAQHKEDLAPAILSKAVHAVAATLIGRR